MINNLKSYLILITVTGLSAVSLVFIKPNIAFADVEDIPYNPEFPKAQYPYAQAPDACSGVTNRPDSNGEIRDTWGSVDFRGACNTHDTCYYRLGSNWNTCNERLYSDLRAACERDLRIAVRNPFTGKKSYLPPDPFRLSACYTIATGYYTGVQAGVGVGVFREAQNLQKRYEDWVATVRNPPAPARRYRIDQTGAIYYANGNNHYCWYQSWGDYVRLTGGVRDWKAISSTDSLGIYDGVCKG